MSKTWNQTPRPDRIQKAKAYRDKGWSLARIADKLGVSYQRIQQMLHKAENPTPAKRERGSKWA